MNRAVLAAAACVGASLLLVSCQGYQSGGSTGSSTNVPDRIFASLSVSAGLSLSGLITVDGSNDTLARVASINAGLTPTFMVPSPNLATLLVYDAALGDHSIEFIDTQKDTNLGAVGLAGPTSSIVLPLPGGPAYAAVPSAFVSGGPQGAVQVVDLPTRTITSSIGVPGVQTVVANSNGTVVMAFSPDRDVMTVVIPANINTSNPITVAIQGFDRPVSAVVNGSIAYVLNCGAECGGVQASVQAFDLNALALIGPAVPVDGATVGLLSGTTLYVAGNSGTNFACTGQTTAATSCGRLDVIDTTTTPVSVTSSVVVTDGSHTLLNMSLNGQLFVGSVNCTNVGNVVNPSGEVRGCLSIVNTTSGNSVIVPPDNGDVTGLQSFTTRTVEYVVQGSNLRIYDTTQDVLQETQLNVNGGFYDVKAVDFF